MSNDLISRKSLMDEISNLQVTITGLRSGKGMMMKYMEEYRKSVLKCIDESPTSYDLDLIRCAIGKCRMVHKYEHPGYENNLCAGLRTLNGEGEPCDTCKECLLYYGNPKWNEEE